VVSFGVFRVWEKIKIRIQEEIDGGSVLSRLLFNAIKALKGTPSLAESQNALTTDRYNCLYKNNYITFSYSGIFSFTAIKKAFTSYVFYSRVHEHLGLDNCNNIFVGAAPMHQETLKFFVDLNLPIFGIYGLTECTGVHTLNLRSPTQLKFDSCGKNLNGVETKPTSGDDEEVKICLWPACLLCLVDFASWKTHFHGLPWYGREYTGDH